MKAYVFERTGGPEVLQMRDIEGIEPGAHEVRIRVRAFGINRAETYLRSGRMGPVEGPRVPGIEAVGEIAEDPSGCFAVGTRVATAMGGLQLTRRGSYAEEVTVLRSNVISLEPTMLPWEELATLPQAYLTAWGALSQSLCVDAGQTLLIRGGTSSVGLAAIGYANMVGLNVLATTRSASHVERLYAAGAHHVLIDSGQIAHEVARTCPFIDAALEIVGASTVLDTAKMIRPFGAATVIGLLGGALVLDTFNLALDFPPAVRLAFFQSELLGTSALPLDGSPLPLIVHDLAHNRLPSIHAITFDFDEVRKAHEFMESGRALGKIVVRV